LQFLPAFLPKLIFIQEEQLQPGQLLEPGYGILERVASQVKRLQLAELSQACGQVGEGIVAEVQLDQGGQAEEGQEES
jgi:hypothetical protein